MNKSNEKNDANFNGFTLVEMIVALAIGAGISVMSYQALDGMIRADARVSIVVRQVDSLDRVWQYFSSDLIYAVDRSSAISKLPAMTGVFGDRLAQSDAAALNQDEYLLRFVRGGRDNLLNLPRSSLYEVAYSLSQEDNIEGQTLWRDRRPIDVDELITAVPRKKRRLLDGVKRLQFEYLPATFTELDSSAWATGWPLQSANQKDSMGLPAAVRITIETTTIGEIVRIFSVTAADSGG
jgi:general secretion pathway protein J